MATLKELRKLCGLTQQGLADKAGINIRHIQKYDSGECSLSNMTAKIAAALSKALGCSIEELISLDTSIFTAEAAESIKSGDLTISDVVAMSKYQKVMDLSKIGRYGDTFRANYNRIPESLINKLSAEETAQLVDSYYDAYSAGKNSK